MCDLIQEPEVKPPHDLFAYDTATFSTEFTFLKARMHLLDEFLDSQTQSVEQRSFLEIESKHLFCIGDRNLSSKRFNGPELSSQASQ